MTRFVLDASVALAWAFDEDADGYARTVLEALKARRAVVPALWVLEMANGLLVGERRRKISSIEAADFLQRLDALDIEVDAFLPHLTLVWGGARDHGLTAYDFAYLSLARRRALPLATRDGMLAGAARAAGVALFEEL